MTFPPAPALRSFDPADRPGVARAAAPTKPLSAADFSGVAAKLNPLTTKPGAPGGAPADAAAKHAELTETTQKWVAQSFFGTLIKQMRNSPFKSELFEGGRGGQAFQELHDQHLVDHTSRSAGKKLVASLVKKIEAKSKPNAAAAYAKQKGAGREAALTASQASLLKPQEPGGRTTSAPTPADQSNPFKNVRVHVAPGL